MIAMGCLGSSISPNALPLLAALWTYPGVVDKKYRRYSPEFKRHALKRASEDGVTDKEVCEDLGVSRRKLRRWRDQYRLISPERRL